MTTTQDIMKLAYALARSYMSLQEAETFLALESAVKALVAERDALLAENDKLSDLWSVMKAERDALQAKLDDAGRQEPPQNHIYCVFDKTYRLHFWSRAEADKVRSQFSCSTMPFLERIDLLDAHPAPQPMKEPVADRAFLERTLTAMEGVIDVADRKTDEFDELRACIINLTLMLHSLQPAQPAPQAAAPQPLERIAECAARLVEHADFRLGGILSADSKAKDIPSKAVSQVKSRHLAALRDSLAAHGIGAKP